MSKTYRLGRRARRRLRKQLWDIFGDHCCWCDTPMKYPTNGAPMEDFEEMATLEHHFAKATGDIHSTMHLRLAHRRCNR